jgi:hypothetical protein
MQWSHCVEWKPERKREHQHWQGVALLSDYDLVGHEPGRNLSITHYRAIKCDAILVYVEGQVASRLPVFVVGKYREIVFG